MHIKRKREPGLVTAKFENSDIDLNECNEFIKNWMWYALIVCSAVAKIRKITDRNLCLSAAMEACYVAYCCPNRLIFRDIKCLIQSECKRCIYHSMIRFGHTPDRKRVYFPSQWVSLEYFQLYYNKPHFEHLDMGYLLDSPVFTESEKIFIKLFLKGHDPIEISKITGYGSRWVHQCFQKLRGRFKDCKEVEFFPKEKWGAIGPRKK
jgi:hypothetical protein